MDMCAPTLPALELTVRPHRSVCVVVDGKRFIQMFQRSTLLLGTIEKNRLIVQRGSTEN